MGAARKRVSRTAASKAEPKPKKAKVATTCLEKTEQKASEKPRRQLKVANSDEEVRKMVRDNFVSKGFPVNLVDEYEVAGVTLRQELKADKKAVKNKESNIAFGSTYYKDMWDKFTPSSAPIKQLKVGDQSQPLNKELEKAMGHFLAHIPKYDSIKELLATCGPLNQRSYVFLLRGCLKTSPSRSMNACEALLEVLRYHQRTGMHTTFSSEFALVKPHLEMALLRQLDHFRGQEQSGHVWWKTAKKYGCVILPGAATQKCMDVPADGDWTQCVAELTEVVQSGPCGESLFGDALKTVSAGSCTSRIMDIGAKLLLSNITKESIEAARADFAAFCKLTHKDPCATHKFQIQNVLYRGGEFPVSVNSPIDHFKLVVAASCKTVAVDRGVLNPLWCENELMQRGRTLTTVSIDETLIEDMKNAREAAEVFATDCGDRCGAALKAILEKRHQVLSQMDHTWRIEKSFFLSTIGDVGEERLRTLIIRALPSLLARSRPVENSLAALETIGEGMLISFVGLGAQAVYRSVKAMVLAIKERKAPAKMDSNSAFMKTVLGCLAFFCTYELSGGVAEAAVTLHGREALDAIYKKLALNVTAGAGADLSVALLEKLHIFDWLLTEAEKTQSFTWKLAMVDVATVAAASHFADTKKLSTLKKATTKNVKDMLKSMSL
jgi:hypothetical protein